MNAIYSGPFVTKAKEIFSNSQNSNLHKWLSYTKADVKRQGLLEVALSWVSRDWEQDYNLEKYMSEHRNDISINELQNNFNDVINWVSNVFVDVEEEMKTIDWGKMYYLYHNTPYDKNKISEKLHELYGDFYVKDKKGCYEYILKGCKQEDLKLLNISLFDDPTKKSVYERQTQDAKQNGVSNCPLCIIENSSNKDRIWDLKEMDADHVSAWSKGGSTSIENCQMLCRTHNHIKGNR